MKCLANESAYDTPDLMDRKQSRKFYKMRRNSYKSEKTKSEHKVVKKCAECEKDVSLLLNLLHIF